MSNFNTTYRYDPSRGQWVPTGATPPPPSPPPPPPPIPLSKQEVGAPPDYHEDVGSEVKRRFFADGHSELWTGQYGSLNGGGMHWEQRVSESQASQLIAEQQRQKAAQRQAQTEYQRKESERKQQARALRLPENASQEQINKRQDEQTFGAVLYMVIGGVILIGGLLDLLGVFR